MKSSTILKLVLEKYCSYYSGHYPGICENLAQVVHDTYSKDDVLTPKAIFESVILYVEKYKPSTASMYWWPTDDVETRIDVLQKAIVDAEALGD